VNDQEQRLRRAFRAVRAEAPVEQPDWVDVMRRTRAIPDARPARRAPSRILIAAVVAIFAGILALPPLGLGSRLVDLVQPNPAKSVRNEFSFMNRNSRGVVRDAIVSKTRRLVTITQYGRPLSLWVAPTKHGGACYLVRSPTGSAGSCLGAEQYRRGLTVSLSGLGGPAPAAGSSATLGPLPGLSPSAALLSGHAGANAASAELRYTDGTRGALPLHGGWFLFAVPLAHLRTGHRPVSLVSLDSSGNVLHAETQLFEAHVRYHPQTPVASSIRKLATSNLQGGSHAVLWTARSRQGNQCIAVLVDGKSKHFPMWECGHVVGRRVLHEFGPEGVIRNSLLHWEPSAGGDPPSALPIASGWAAAPIASVRVRYADGTTTPLALHDRLFLYLVPASHRTGASIPSRLEGVDTQGKIVQSIRIDRRRCARGARWTCPFPS
jgi:hypothetical protein